MIVWDCLWGPKVIDQVLNIRLLRWLSWVFATQEKKKEKSSNPKRLKLGRQQSGKVSWVPRD